MKISASGYWKVIKNGVQISRHVQDYKAFESAVNAGGAVIIPPDKITVTVEGKQPDSVKILNVE